MSPEEKIRKTIETGNVSHAYIFEGSRISGKETAAKSFIAAVKGIKDLDSDPDHYVVRAEAGQGRTVRSVKDADMEKLQADLKMKPQGDRNSAIIYDADTMTLYVTGGGGCLVRNFGQFNTDRVRFVDDICAAAKGYEYMAELQLRAGRA